MLDTLTQPERKNGCQLCDAVASMGQLAFCGNVTLRIASSQHCAAIVGMDSDWHDGQMWGFESLERQLL